MPLPLIPLIGLALNLVPSLVGHAFGSNAEQVTSAVANVAKEVFGTDDKDQVERAIAQSPDLALKFKAKLLDLQEAENQRAHDERMAILKDGQHARDTYAKTGGHTVPVLAIVTVILFFVANGAMLWGAYTLLTSGFKVSNTDLAIACAGFVGQVAGFLNSKTDLVYSFFFGSSVSSRSNAQATNATLADIARKALGR